MLKRPKNFLNSFGAFVFLLGKFTKIHCRLFGGILRFFEKKNAKSKRSSWKIKMLNYHWKFFDYTLSKKDLWRVIFLTFECQRLDIRMSSSWHSNVSGLTLESQDADIGVSRHWDWSLKKWRIECLKINHLQLQKNDFEISPLKSGIFIFFAP